MPAADVKATGIACNGKGSEQSVGAGGYRLVGLRRGSQYLFRRRIFVEVADDREGVRRAGSRLEGFDDRVRLALDGRHAGLAVDGNEAHAFRHHELAGTSTLHG